MLSNKLPSPIYIDINKYNNIKKITDYVYENFFKFDFMDKNKREKFNGKFIFLELDFIEYKPERFWHLISFDPNEEKYSVYPCTNTIESGQCNNMKIDCSSQVHIPNNQNLIKRCECLYRIKRINWINPIIKLANQDSEYIKIWEQQKTTDKGNIIKKTFIRFQEGRTDYLIILLNQSLNGENKYKFITAYPVTHIGTKKNLDKNYKIYIK